MTHAIQKRVPASPPRITWEEFVEWAIANEVSAEWVDGQVEYKRRYFDPITGETEKVAGEEHSALVVFLVTLINVFNDFKGLGSVYADQYLMKIGPKMPGREPDLIFVLNGNSRVVVRKNFMDGPADLIVEVVSRESIECDRVTKKREYEAGGVREYWLVDPLVKEAIFYVLGADGVYSEAERDPEGKFHSTVLPGLWLKSDWLWQNPPPKLPEIMRQWELI